MNICTVEFKRQKQNYVFNKLKLINEGSAAATENLQNAVQAFPAATA